VEKNNFVFQKMIAGHSTRNKSFDVASQT